MILQTSAGRDVVRVPPFEAIEVDLSVLWDLPHGRGGVTSTGKRWPVRIALGRPGQMNQENGTAIPGGLKKNIVA